MAAPRDASTLPNTTPAPSVDPFAHDIDILFETRLSIGEPHQFDHDLDTLTFVRPPAPTSFLAHDLDALFNVIGVEPETQDGIEEDPQNSRPPSSSSSNEGQTSPSYAGLADLSAITLMGSDLAVIGGNKSQRCILSQPNETQI